MIFVILIISAVTAAVLGFLIFYSISTTLSKLKKIVEKFEDGKYNEQIKIDSNDELEEFSKSFETIRTILLKKEKLKNIGELSSRLAHDLRNPLTVIKGAIQLIKMDLNNEKKSNMNRIKMINLAISRMTHQINDVMDFVRITELQLKNHSLLELLESSVFRIGVDEVIEIQMPQNDIILSCDSIKLNILFINIISNAIDAVKPHGTIKIRLFDDESEIKIEIEDSGPEITSHIITNMFEPLFTTKETGLGLASCKNIAEQHGGKILVKTKPTIVSIILSKNISEYN